MLEPWLLKPNNGLQFLVNKRVLHLQEPCLCTLIVFDFFNSFSLYQISHFRVATNKNKICKRPNTKCSEMWKRKKSYKYFFYFCFCFVFLVMGFFIVEYPKVICQCMCSLLFTNVCVPIIWHIICVLTSVCILYRSTSGSKLSTDSTSVTASDCSAVVFLEHVTVNITFTYSRYRGDTEFYLVSPSGTESHLLHYRSKDDQSDESGDTLTWTFMSVHFWWENPLGTWTLQFRSRCGLSKGKDTCIGLNIRFSTHIYFLWIQKEQNRIVTNGEG